MAGQYRSTKTFGHELGLSSAFRQWRAESHCRLIHGYALAIHLVFEADELDVRNWVVDFGSLKGLKQWFTDTFDHKLLVAADDPAIHIFRMLSRPMAMTNHGVVSFQAAREDYAELGLIAPVVDIVEVEACGCEAFAKLVAETTDIWLGDNGYKPRVRLVSAEVREHGANSAIFIMPTPKKESDHGVGVVEHHRV